VLTPLDAAVASGAASGALYNLGGLALMAFGRPAEALVAFDRALASGSDMAEVHANRAGALGDLGRLREAKAAFDRALALNPELPGLHGYRLHARMQLCDWAGFDSELTRLGAIVEAGQSAAPPFALMSVLDDPRLLRMAAAIESGLAGEPAHTIPARPATARPLHIGAAAAHRLCLGRFSPASVDAAHRGDAEGS
jgi:tetratricopeptide (TPR) repeat protein